MFVEVFSSREKDVAGKCKLLERQCRSDAAVDFLPARMLERRNFVLDFTFRRVGVSTTFSSALLVRESRERRERESKREKVRGKLPERFRQEFTVTCRDLFRPFCGTPLWNGAPAYESTARRGAARYVRRTQSSTSRRRENSNSEGAHPAAQTALPLTNRRRRFVFWHAESVQHLDRSGRSPI